MTSRSISTFPTRSTLPWRRLALVFSGSAALGLLIALMAVLLSPIGVRWRANQTAAAPVIGAVYIDILADPELNHVFAPAVTQIEAGQAVTWRFADIDEDGEPVAHNIVFDDMASPVQTEGTFSREFAEPGTYSYVCTLHPFMEGAVVVTEAP